MATEFQLRDPKTGDLVAVRHYGITEVARRLHTSVEFIRRGAIAGRFPHLLVGEDTDRPRRWFTDEDVAAIYAALRVGDDMRPPAPLGLVIDEPEDALAGVR